jgi:lipopolysaccharide transport system ATP-binding protein
MSQVAISVDNVWKRYRKGLTGYHTLREDLYHLAGRLIDFGGEKRRDIDTEHIWALHDVSFQVEQGERVGIIGRNGSGKTTMLRLLAGITKPTKGKIDIRGRIGVLIEIMAGFHPELTGRENIFLNGAIMGMSRKEIKRKFDEIVAFSELENFIDTPIKRYSSGMHVRLGFAVAAHLDPEVLLIDEVLAVGDAAFQKKCLGKMGEAAQEGRTVVFVSHNMASVRDLCPRAIWIDSGNIIASGVTSEIVDSYLQSGRKETTGAECKLDEDPEKDFQLVTARLLDIEGNLTQWFNCDKPVIIALECKVRNPVPGLRGYLMISKKDGTRVMESDSHDAPPNPLDGLLTGTYSTRVTVPARTLGPGDYDVYINFGSSLYSKGQNVDSPGVVCSFHLDDLTSMRGNRRGGFFSTMLPWKVSPL